MAGMASNLGLVPRAESPASFDTSPRPTSRNQRRQDEPLLKDKAFRRYASGVDRALSLFDTTLQGWADYISFLSRLHKALESHPDNAPIVPNKFVVAKRLAQCLQPSLPSGVHQKALEVYAFIFTLIGRDGLEDDLGVYLPGIASTLTFGSISVRSMFLSLVESHVLKISTTTLRPALKALILALLPGLEEETGDDFERTLQALVQCQKAFRSAGKGEVFWQNLFLASITNPGRRQGVLSFLIRYLPKLYTVTNSGEEKTYDGTADIDELITPEPGLLIRCFATGLADEQVLVQRAFLDLLVSHLPLHVLLFHDTTAAENLRLLVSAAVCVVLRRDMSLNRRLWSWFVGLEGKEEPEDIAQVGNGTFSQSDRTNQMENARPYFRKFGLQPLIAALDSMIAQSSTASSLVSRPFRIALSLMDRWEIGNPVVNAIFLNLMRKLRAYRLDASSPEDFQEVFRSANVFFDGAESTLVWSKMLTLLLPLGKEKKEALLDLELASFVLGNFNFAEDEMVNLHIPLVSLAMLVTLHLSDEPLSSSHKLDQETQVYVFDLLHLLVDVIPQSVFMSRFPTSSDDSLPTSNEILKKVQGFYDRSQDVLGTPASPFAENSIGRLFFHFISRMISIQLETEANGQDLDQNVTLLTALRQKSPASGYINSNLLIKALRARLEIESLRTPISFHLVSSASALFIELYQWVSQSQDIDIEDAMEIIANLVASLWGFLSPSSPQYHLHTFQLIMRLEQITWRESVVMCTLLSQLSSDLAQYGHGPLHFTVFWTHASNALALFDSKAATNTQQVQQKPAGGRRQAMKSLSEALNMGMLMLLNILRSPTDRWYASSKTWLQSLSDLSSVIGPLLISSRQNLYLSQSAEYESDAIEIALGQLDHLDRLLEVQSNEQWKTFGYSRTGSRSHGTEGQGDETLAISVLRLCHEVIAQKEPANGKGPCSHVFQLLGCALSLVRRIIINVKSPSLMEIWVDRAIVQQLGYPHVLRDLTTQSDLLDTLILITSFKMTCTQTSSSRQEDTMEERPPTASHAENATSTATGSNENNDDTSVLLKPAPDLLDCILKGITSSVSPAATQKWVQLLSICIGLYKTSIFQVSMRVIECLCKQILTNFNHLKLQFSPIDVPPLGDFESVLFHLLNGLDYVLARTHEQLLTQEEELVPSKTPEQTQGLFGSMMAASLPPGNRQPNNTMNNDRLSVILCFHDALRACVTLWSWQKADSIQTSNVASFQYISQKLRNRSRKILEHLLVAEPLESIEMLVSIWAKARSGNDLLQTTSLMGLFHTLEGSRPNVTMGTLFSAIYARNDRNALETSQQPTLSSNLDVSDLVTFLNSYAMSLEEDALDEIWVDCMQFLRSVLSNPMPHRHILTRLISFVAILSAKMENTNFGEERKMRRDLSDLLVRLLTAIFTIKPQNTRREKPQLQSRSDSNDERDSVDIDQILVQNFGMFITLLGETDRLVAVMTSIVTNLIAPIFRSRSFPENVNSFSLNLLLEISKVPNASKAWKKELTECLNDARLFASPNDLVKDQWLPLLRSLTSSEKSFVPEILSRLTTPTAPGMFGVGATAARLEADKKTQLNLRRVASSLLAADKDAFASQLGTIQAKLEELFTATATSSPSSLTRADIYMLVRALVLKSSSRQMASFYPLLNSELHDAFRSVLSGPDTSSRTYTNYSVLQAAKLLDVLLLANPDEFQAQEWLFVTDTIDAIYRPEGWQPSAVIDEVAQQMGNSDLAALTPKQWHENSMVQFDSSLRKPLLCGDRTRTTPETEIGRALLSPFFNQLSIQVYERTYGLVEPDLDACQEDLLRDIFNPGSIVTS